MGSGISNTVLSVSVDFQPWLHKIIYLGTFKKIPTLKPHSQIIIPGGGEMSIFKKASQVIPIARAHGLDGSLY